MPDQHHPEDQERLQSYLRVHLKDDELSLTDDEQINILKKKNRKQNWFLVINIAAILFFGYSFFYNITQLGDTFLYILFGVFVLNVALIYFQKKQLTKLIDYLQHKSGQA